MRDRKEHFRKLTELGRLMIKLADPALVAQLQELARSRHEIVAAKAGRMLGQIVNTPRQTAAALDRRLQREESE